MSNLSLLLVALVFAALQQLVVVGSDSDNDYDQLSNERAPKPTTTTPATATTLAQAGTAHQHRHQHFVGSPRANEQVHSPTPMHQEQQQQHHQRHHHHEHHHEHHHHQPEQQQQQQTPWFRFDQELKFAAPTSTRPTTKTPAKAQHKSQHWQQLHSGLKSMAAATANHIGQQSAGYTASKQSASARLAEVNLPSSSPFFNNSQAKSSSSLPSAWLRRESSNQQQQQQQPQQQPADANRSHYLRSSAVRPAPQSAERPRSTAAAELPSPEYTDEYYYDDDDVLDLDDEYEENEDAANELELANDRISAVAAAARAPRSRQVHDSSLGRALAGRKLQGGGRRYLDEQQQQLRSAKEQDYADDEPYRSASGEFFQNDAPGVLTDQKFRELGTLEAVQQTRDKYLLDQEHTRQKTPAELAREHMDRMKTAGRCSRPLPRVIHVSNETSKRYVPYCTILHRCGEDTGCCDSTRQVCAAKSFEDVPVYFFVIKVSSRSNKRDTEVLMLRNHTECHCVDRSILSTSMHYMPRDKRSDLSYHRRYRQHHHQQQQQHHPQHHHDSAKYQSPPEQQQQQQQYQQQLEPQSLQLSYSLKLASTSSQPVDEAANTICRCPKHFDIFPEDAPPPPPPLPLHNSPASEDLPELRCRCDCLSHNVPCRRLQKGEEGFAMDERKCIAENLCQAPVCLHGDYNRHTGRCPHRKHHKRTVTRYDYGYG